MTIVRNCIQLLTKKKKNQIGTLGHQVVLFLGVGTLSGTSERASNFRARVLSTPLLSLMLSQVPARKELARNQATGFPFLFQEPWSSLTIDAPRRLALAPLFSYPHPWPTALFSRSPDAPSVTTTVPAQTHTASIPLDECPNATGS